MSNFTVFFEGLSFGLVVCAPIGPVFAASIRFGISGGFLSALKVQIGSLIGDVIYALLGISVLSVFETNQFILNLFGYTTVAVLLILAISSLNSALRDHKASLKTSVTAGPFLTGTLISLLSFDNLALWAGVTQVYVGDRGQMSPQIYLFLGGFMSAAIIWVVCSAALAGYGLRRSSPAFIRLAHVLISCALFIFAFRIFVGLQ